jgi:hypothetical protein
MDGMVQVLLAAAVWPPVSTRMRDRVAAAGTSERRATWRKKKFLQSLRLLLQTVPKYARDAADD